MFGKYNKKKQQELADKFEAGDIEISVCNTCFIYFKHPLNPREICHGCLVKTEACDKEIHNGTGRRFRHWNATGRKKEVQLERNEMMKAIRSKVKTVPKILRPIREIDPSKYKRECLKCSKEFLADSKFQRLCEADRITASSIGFGEHTHYYVYDQNNEKPMDKRPSRRKLHRKLREKSEADGEFQDGEYEEPEELNQPEPEE